MENHHVEKAAERIAGKMYQPAYDESHTDAEQGLAITQEQVNDVYAAGTIDGMVEK
jgi:hypothetical protein